MEYYSTNKDKKTTEGARSLKLKVCGMNKNTSAVATLKPDYLGFIFWEPSKRFFDNDMPSISHEVKKVGVFVDASIPEVLEKVEKFGLWGVQLHGKESPAFCEKLRDGFLSFRAESRKKKTIGTSEVSTPLDQTDLVIIKVFSIKNNFNFEALRPFEDVCDFYLFDTKGKLPGGNGYAFNWEILENYPSTKPYFLSGGIGSEELESLQEFLERPESQYCHAIDVNSKFEVEPGLKSIKKINEFKKSLTDNCQHKTDDL
jgi:phosphoribosylanthranilate isomerase